MKTTRQSEFGRIKSVVIKRATDAFVSERLLHEQWKELHFLGKPDFVEAAREFDAFESILKSNGASSFYLPSDESLTIDSLYCRDAAVATDHGMILGNMGKTSRVNEPEAELRLFVKHHIPVLGRILSPGTLEGGDCAWLDTHTLAVGKSRRTNAEGISQLKNMLATFGIQILIVALPDYKGPQDVFHLMSVFSPVDEDLAIVYTPLMPSDFREELLRRGYQLVEVPDKEFESMACNVLAIAPRKCVMLEGNPKTKDMLEKAGCHVSEYKGLEISIKGGGGPTCLTRPIKRQI